MKAEGAAGKAEGSIQNPIILKARQSCTGRRGEPGSGGWEAG